MIQVQQDTAEAYRDAVRRVFAARDYDWTEARSPFAVVRDLFLDLMAWLELLEITHPVVHRVLLVALVALLVVIFAHFAYLIFKALRPRAAVQARDHTCPARPRDARWFLEHARALAAEERYAEAMAHRFSALLLHLNGIGAVAFHPSKTPAEYRRELRGDAEVESVFGSLVGRLYAVLFGRSPCTDSDFAEFDRLASDVAGSVATS